MRNKKIRRTADWTDRIGRTDWTDRGLDGPRTGIPRTGLHGARGRDRGPDGPARGRTGQTGDRTGDQSQTHREAGHAACPSVRLRGRTETRPPDGPDPGPNCMCMHRVCISPCVILAKLRLETRRCLPLLQSPSPEYIYLCRVSRPKKTKKIAGGGGGQGWIGWQPPHDD